MSKAVYIILNGELIKENEALISPLNRGMMYGDGCFETLRCYSGKFLGWNRHFQRLSGGLNYLDMEAPFSPKELKNEIQKLLDINQCSHQDVMARIQCWRKGGRGYKPASHEANWMIQLSDISTHSNPLHLTLAQTRCIPSESLSRSFKLSSGLTYIKAAQEAKKRKCDDSLMLTTANKICETTSANIFWIKDDKVFTPADACDLLPGVTRALTKETIQSLGISLEEGIYDFEILEQAEAVFCTNSLMEIREVAFIDQIEYEVNHPMTMKIKVGFEQLKVQKLKA